MEENHLGRKVTILNNIDKYLSDEQLEKLLFLAETVLPYDSLDQVDSIHTIERKLEQSTRIGSNASVHLLKRFLDTIGCVRFAEELCPLIGADEVGYSLPADKLYLYELIILVTGMLNQKSFSQLKNVITDSQLGAHRDRITSPIKLFKRLIEQQTLRVDNIERSKTVICEWLTTIGRLDIADRVREYARPREEQGTMGISIA